MTKMERDPIASYSERMKALGTLSNAIGLATISIGVLSPAIQEGPPRSSGATAACLLVGILWIMAQQVILWNVKKKKEEGDVV